MNDTVWHQVSPGSFLLVSKRKPTMMASCSLKAELMSEAMSRP